MRLDVCVLFLLLICCVCLQRVDCRLPDFTPATPQLQVKVSMTSDSSVRTEHFGRLPGLCRRLKRRRVTVLCNQERFCWRGRGYERSSGRSLKTRAGQGGVVAPSVFFNQSGDCFMIAMETRTCEGFVKNRTYERCHLENGRTS